MPSEHETIHLEHLGERVRRAIGEGPDERRRARQRSALLDSLPLHAPRSRRLIVAAVAAAVAGLALSVGVWRLSSPSALDYWVGGAHEPRPGQGLVRASDRSVPIYFGDGSQVELKGSTTARIVESSTRRVSIALGHGTLAARVRSRPQTRYRVTAGPFSVQDIGTAFQVSWNPGRAHLEVEVREGVVLVGGGALGAPVRMEAGARLDVVGGAVTLSRRGDRERRGPRPGKGPMIHREPVPRPPEAAAGSTASSDRRHAREPVPAHPSRQPDVGARTVPAPVEVAKAAEPAGARAAAPPAVPPAAPPAALPPRPSSWRRSYDEGDYVAVMRQARSAGLDGLASTASSDDLWKLASAARYTRDARVARLLLVAIRRRFPPTRRARTAAFLLGRVAIELDGDATEAIRWFERYLTEDPGGPLTEEAHGRLIIACQRAGRHAAAGGWARRYLSRHGDGLYAAIARAALQRAAGQ